MTSDSGTGSVFTYDQNGNRTTAGYSTGVANRLATDGSWNYTYDWEGNVSSKTRISDGHYWSYGYDWNNQMTSAVDRVTVGGSIIQTINYGYDVYGNLVSKSTAGVVTKYTYEITDKGPGFAASVNTLWAELNGAGAVTLRYLTVGDETVARSDGANQYWLLADRQGSTRDVTNAAGVFVDHVEYTTFGGILSESNAAVSGNVLFTGGLYDRLTGLYGMHWRSYDPQSGQWTGEDPLGFAAGDMNQRRYVGNGATNGVDRNGLQEKLPLPRLATELAPGPRIAPSKLATGMYPLVSAILEQQARDLRAKIAKRAAQEPDFTVGGNPTVRAMTIILQQDGGEKAKSLLKPLNDGDVVLKTVYVSPEDMAGYADFLPGKKGVSPTIRLNVRLLGLDAIAHDLKSWEMGAGALVFELARYEKMGDQVKLENQLRTKKISLQEFAVESEYITWEIIQTTAKIIRPAIESGLWGKGNDRLIKQSKLTKEGWLTEAKKPGGHYYDTLERGKVISGEK